MPYRQNPIGLDEIYHVFNRSVAKQPIFLSSKDYKRAVNVFTFYLYNPPIRFSYFNNLASEQKIFFLTNLVKTSEPLVDIISFCLMPNHVHFLLKNKKEGGISKFMRIFQNSYAKYFNTKLGRTGSLFQDMFQAKRVESDEQLIHVSRYIHLNPVTSYIIEAQELKNYLWSSYPYYLNPSNRSSFIHPEIILNNYKSLTDYEKFTLDQADYQRELDKIKHLTLEA